MIFCQPVYSFALTGDSGGGYICAGAMVQLASKDEGDLIKLAVPIIAMLDDYEFSSRESMTNDAAERVVMMQKIWETIGGKEFEAKRSARDPILFPGNTLKNNFICLILVASNQLVSLQVYDLQAKPMPVCWQRCRLPSSGSQSLTSTSRPPPGAQQFFNLS